MSLQNKVGIWTHNTFKCYGHLHDIKNLGFDYLAVKITDGDRAFCPGQRQGLSVLAARVPLEICAWAYVYPNNIPETIAAIKSNLPDGCTDLILDCEAEWENKSANLAHELCSGIAEATEHKVSLHLSSFCNPSEHPLPYEAFLSHCQSFQPQTYAEGSTPFSRVEGRYINEALPLASKTLGGLVIPTVNTPELVTLLKGKTAAGFNVWLWDGVQLGPGQTRAAGDDMGVQGYESAWSKALSAP